jgi:hypothetical protein
METENRLLEQVTGLLRENGVKVAAADASLRNARAQIAQSAVDERRITGVGDYGVIEINGHAHVPKDENPA